MKIAGTEIADAKHVVISLTGIFGIGRSTSMKILDTLGIPHNKKVRDLDDAEKQKLVDELEKYNEQNKINNGLKRKILRDIEHYRTIRCRRGIRLEKKLPVRGQRTHTNAKSCKRCSLFNTNTPVGNVKKKDKR